ncbi:hypothetical protein SVEN_0657 [Streptomyces venezuelae ATCC 10712]|uniref:Uncharacterized protein n=1 Tax=Streptomyces venezuelae (strain ATCC 10712 / CBS 650.69 / DSM 40230 / JCM 4526 / NBRC 13096 / PD 04745) TaxID=953739 RepID=F2R8M6_STRVP|nr:hypothetical protein SVEN_0657 [Streptomyces venezuelae ATCC 10712]
MSEAQRKGLAAFARGDAVLRDAHFGGAQAHPGRQAHGVRPACHRFPLGFGHPHLR